jgi:wyosine [tRNA(Phe)-imidazoG37] synthetase (radical SAM superfamily)
MTIPLQQGIIYGPVNSRRLGRSLGVNIVSTKIKTCTFNCVYCQYGLRRISDEYLTARHWYPSTSKIIDTLGEILPMLNPPPAYITFSGNGEATLHPDFSTIVDQVKLLRDKYTFQAAVAILSNSSTVITEEIRDALSGLDRKIMKLDCGDEETFKRYNQPLPGIVFGDIIKGLKQMDNITIQALFSGGSGGNYSDDHVQRWVKKIIEIAPADVQIYTLDRSYPSEFITPLSREELLKIKDLVIKEGIKAEVY